MNEKPKGPGIERILLLQQDTLYDLLTNFREGKPANWPVAPAQKVHRLWSHFVETGKVSNEKDLQDVLDSMLRSLAHLCIANIVSGHEGMSPQDYLEGELDACLVEDFCDWLIEDETGHWRISDYGTGPLAEALALAFEARSLPTKLKYMDRALHVVHMRGDLARLFIEGGRASVNKLAELEPA